MKLKIRNKSVLKYKYKISEYQPNPQYPRFH